MSQQTLEFPSIDSPPASAAAPDVPLWQDREWADWLENMARDPAESRRLDLVLLSASLLATAMLAAVVSALLWLWE